MKRVVIKWTYLLAVIAFGVWVFNAFLAVTSTCVPKVWFSHNRPSSLPNTPSPFGM